MACTISPAVQVTALAVFAAPRHSIAIMAMVSDLTTPLAISRSFRAIPLVTWSSRFAFMCRHLDVFRQCIGRWFVGSRLRSCVFLGIFGADQRNLGITVIYLPSCIIFPGVFASLASTNKYADYYYHVRSLFEARAIARISPVAELRR